MKIKIVEKSLKTEMASILAKMQCADITDLGCELEMIVFVNDSERNHAPHMHIQVRPRCDRGTNSEPIFETCVRLDTAEYSLHSAKFREFPSGEWLELFVNLINSKSQRMREPAPLRCWDRAVIRWNDSMSANYWVSDDCNVPDYTKLSVDENMIPIITRKLTALFR